MSDDQVRPSFAIRTRPPLITGDPAIDALDLGPIKFKMQTDKIGKEDWSNEELEIVEDQYRAFLALTKRYPDVAMVPTEKLDYFWHQHMLDSKKYFEDCDAVFGQYLHHFPYFGMREEDGEDFIKAGNLSATTFEAEFPNVPSPYTWKNADNGESVLLAGCIRVSCTNCRIKLCNHILA